MVLKVGEIIINLENHSEVVDPMVGVCYTQKQDENHAGLQDVLLDLPHLVITRIVGRRGSISRYQRWRLGVPSDHYAHVDIERNEHQHGCQLDKSAPYGGHDDETDHGQF